MSKLQDIKQKEIDWEKEYINYKNTALEIDKKIKAVSNKISVEVCTVNTLKEVLEPQVRILYSFLSGIGNVTSLPNYSTLKKDSFDGYVPKAYVLTSNKKEYINEKDVRRFKEVGRAFGDYLLHGGTGRYSGSTLKNAYLIAEQNFGVERMEWTHDVEERKDILDTYKLKLKIAELYHNVFSVVKWTVETIIIPEIPGIKAFLYAQGVKDAVFSGKLPSESKPVPINRFLRSTAYQRHVNFVKNAHDFYVMFKKYYENDYLTRLLESEDESVIYDDINNFSNKSELLKSNSVFGGKYE